MSFESLNNVLEAIAKQPKWEKVRQYHQLVECWQKVVNDKIAQNTRPLYLKRQILWVASVNSVWSQNLTLQRYSLMKKLNQLLDEPIIDIRFSPAKWYQKNQSNFYDTSNLSKHPSYINIDTDVFSDLNHSKPTNPQEAFLQWKEVIKRRADYLVTCAYCGSPTPEGEIKRWEMCAFCFAKKNSS